MKKEKLLSLQICRALAALLVVLYHYTLNVKVFFNQAFLHSFFLFGHAGVNFFFVLSGFIICFTHWDDLNSDISSVKKYFVKRLNRILTSYWPVLIGLSLLYFYFGAYASNTHLIITPSVFLKNAFLIPDGTEPIVVVAWTLQYEMLFYAIFALFILNSRLGFAALFTWITAIIFFNLGWFIPSSPWLQFACNLCCCQFLMGCLIAYAIKRWSQYILYPYALLFLGTVGFLLCGLQEDYYHHFSAALNGALYALCSVGIIIGLVKIEKHKSIFHKASFSIFHNSKTFLFKLFVFLGAASYCIYLTNNTLLRILFRLMQHIHGKQLPLLSGLFVLLVCIAMGCLFYVVYEKPMLLILTRRSAHSLGEVKFSEPRP